MACRAAVGDNVNMMLAVSFLHTLAQQPAPVVQQPASNTLLIWAIVMIAVAVTLFIVEVFVPSGGIIAAVSALCLVIGIVMLFGVNTWVGLAASGASLIAIPFFVAFLLKIWPHTPIGRRLMLAEDEDEEDAALMRPNPSAKSNPVSVGAVGQALTDMRPVGSCLFDGKRIECLSTRGVIPAGAKVEVIDAGGMEIKVRAVDD